MNKAKDIAQTIITGLKNGTSPLMKPWTPDQCQMPYNPVTGTRYKGVNVLQLISQGKEDPRWMTYNQALNNGWQVKRGSEGTRIQYWQFDKEVKSDNLETGKQETRTVRLERPVLRHYYVFNGSDIEGIPELKQENSKENEWNRHEGAENILKNSGADIEHERGDRAAYSPRLDKIILPERNQFDSADKYYAVALHEMGHWTGHESRLNRDITNVFGSKDYAREELRAEIASFITGMELGIGYDPGQHLSYVDSWIQILEDHPTEIYKACGDAEKINAYLLKFENEKARDEVKAMESDTTKYIVTERSFVALTEQGNLDGSPYDENVKKFDNPEEALKAAIDAQKEYSEQLNNDHLFVNEVKPGNDIGSKPILSTDQQIMRSMWNHNIKTPFPEHLVSIKDNNISTGQNTIDNNINLRKFISYISEHNEINGMRTALLSNYKSPKKDQEMVVKFNNAVFKDISETEKVDHLDLSQKGIDGVVITKEGKPHSAIIMNNRSIVNGMFRAAKGESKTYLSVPYEEKDRAKQMGAMWDKQAKSWFIPVGLDNNQFNNWKQTNTITDNPQQQFAEFIRSRGGDLQGELPIMDGKIHRIPEIGGKKGNQDIAYVGYMDGVPAGYINNHHQKSEERWKLAGVALTNEDRARIIKEGKEKTAQRQKDLEAQYEQKAHESQVAISKLKDATGQEEYFRNKGIDIANPGVKINGSDSIVLPLQDAEGKHWSHLTLKTNGFKSLLKEAKMQGTFGIVGAASIDKIKGDIIIAEGYSTAASIHEATEQPVLVSVTANNLQNVAETIREKYPERNIIIMADDDAHLPLQAVPKVNSGQIAAKQAAAAVGGVVISPLFEESQPSKDRTDFNDMARIRGKKIVKDYLTAKLELAREKTRSQKEQNALGKQSEEQSVER